MALETASAATNFPWAALITALTGLSTALLTNWFAEKRWVKQLQTEKSKEHRKLMISKGEDTFLALKKWEKELFFYHASRIGFLQGAIQQVEADRTISEQIDPGTHGKIDVLIILYFPEFIDMVEEIHKQVSAVNRILQNNVKSPNLVASKKAMEECAIYERQFVHLFKKLKIHLSVL